MTDVDALTAFIRARLDDEEHDALAAGVDVWVANGREVRTAPPAPDGWKVVRSWAHDQDGRAPHIARQDPAATLARVAALRALVDLHREVDDFGTYRTDLPVCDHCADRWPCITVRHVAAIWRDHPDYQPEWMP